MAPGLNWFVIPGRREASNPEPMNTAIDNEAFYDSAFDGRCRVHGFRFAARCAAPGMTAVSRL